MISVRYDFYGFSDVAFIATFKGYEVIFKDISYCPDTVCCTMFCLLLNQTRFFPFLSGKTSGNMTYLLFVLKFSLILNVMINSHKSETEDGVGVWAYCRLPHPSTVRNDKSTGWQAYHQCCVFELSYWVVDAYYTMFSLLFNQTRFFLPFSQKTSGNMTYLLSVLKFSLRAMLKE